MKCLNSTEHLQKKLHSSYKNSFGALQKRKTSTNLFYKISFTNLTKMLQERKFTPISLINTDAKSQTNILAKQLMHYNQMNLFWEVVVGRIMIPEKCSHLNPQNLKL